MVSEEDHPRLADGVGPAARSGLRAGSRPGKLEPVEDEFLRLERPLQSVEMPIEEIVEARIDGIRQGGDEERNFLPALGIRRRIGIARGAAWTEKLPHQRHGVLLERAGLPRFG